jgi:hypothetical protein
MFVCVSVFSAMLCVRISPGEARFPQSIMALDGLGCWSGGLGCQLLARRAITQQAQKVLGEIINLSVCFAGNTSEPPSDFKRVYT